MKRLLITAGAAVGACAIAVPAAAGLAGNPSFSEKVAVRVPHTAHVVSFDDHGRAVERGDHRRGHAGTTPTPAASTPMTSTAQPTAHPGTSTHREPGDDRGTHTEPGDDRGTHTEPGDDRGTHTEPGDDRGGARSSGSDDRTTTAAATTSRGSGSDDAGSGGSDSRGSGRSGGDDGAHGGHGGHGGDD